MFETHVITDSAAFKDLKDEWNSLLQKSHANTIFLTWEWLYTWWEVFGNGGELFIITVRNDKEDLVGLAPLFIKKTKYYKFPVKEMTFIGVGHSDRQDFIISENDPEIIREIIEKIYENKNRCNIVHFEQIPDNSLLASIKFDGGFQPEIELGSLCPFLKIENDWGKYFNSLDRKFRYDIKNKIKQLNKLGTWEFKLTRKEKDKDDLISFMENIEIKSKKTKTEKTFFSVEKNKYFLSNFLKISEENNWIAFSTLTINGNPLTYSLGFIFGDRFYGYSTAYDINYYKYAPGKIVINETIKWFFDNKNVIKMFDFSRGGTDIKAKWTSEVQKHLRIVFFNGSFYSNLIRYTVFYIRPFIKTFLRKKNKIGQLRFS